MAMLRLAYPIHSGFADWAGSFGGGPSVFHRDLRWVANLSIGLALYTIRFHECLQDLIWAHPSRVGIGKQVRESALLRRQRWFSVRQPSEFHCRVYRVYTCLPGYKTLRKLSITKRNPAPLTPPYSALLSHI